MDVAAGDVGGQALRLGLVDQVVMNVVPVVFGASRAFFGSAAGEVTLANPSLVAQGDRVTHLRYDVPQSAGGVIPGWRSRWAGSTRRGVRAPARGSGA